MPISFGALSVGKGKAAGLEDYVGKVLTFSEVIANEDGKTFHLVTTDGNIEVPKRLATQAAAAIGALHRDYPGETEINAGVAKLERGYKLIPPPAESEDEAPVSDEAPAKRK